MNRIATTAIAILICLFTGLAWLALHYHGKYSTAQSEISSAQAITTSMLTAIDLMYVISKAAHEDKQKLADEGETRIVYIREVVKGDQCAVRNVATAATDHLRLLENRVRTGKPTEAKP
ncbi:hypothetical protein [Serratia fonticola]|uniref:hypothetical protein n=1 Tax=Serratia fonticola TaxID=47917 RepID=UPI0024DE3805|nr:hypothetical protein [Serratia fonticola]MDK2375268.1 hypothetical protein [Serratia fonticola]